MNIVAVIPIRGRDKEFKEGKMPFVAGKSLIAYTIKAAKEAEKIDRVIVSTDSSAIAEEAKRFGAEAPFIRPKELSRPGIKLEEVLRHTVLYLEEEEGYKTDILVLLEVTHPIRRKGLIDQVIEVLIKEDLDSCFVAYEEKHNFWVSDEEEGLKMVGVEDYSPREKKGPIYKEMGGIATATRAEFIKQGRRLGDKIGVLPLRDITALIDTHDESGLWLAGMILGEEKDS